MKKSLGIKEEELDRINKEKDPPKEKISPPNGIA
jgi:hypothetical protein